MISGYENGEIEMGLKRFTGICRALEVSPGELLGNTAGFNAEAAGLFSQLDDDNRMFVVKQMKALLVMQAGGEAS